MPSPEVPDDPAALAFLCYTSGTTGRPRGAMLTAGALRANQEQCLAMDPPPVREDDRVLLVLPLFHVYGLNAGFGLVAATGACAVLQSSFDPRASLAVMAAEHVTAVPGAPPMYQAWLAAADAAGSDADLRRAFAAVRLASCGAAPLPAETWTAMRDRAAVTVWEGYGLTEASPVVSSTLAVGRAKPECIGGPLPGVELELRDTAASLEGGDCVDPGPDEEHDDGEHGPGEIWVRGPNLFSGYWPDGVDGPDADGWLGTGDLAYRDAAGDLHLADRRSDLILVSGFNVYPAEVERVLDAHPAVLESAVIGVPDAAHGRGRPCGRGAAARRGGHARGPARARRGQPRPVQGADVGAVPVRPAALAHRQGESGQAARARPRRRRPDVVATPAAVVVQETGGG